MEGLRRTIIAPPLRTGLHSLSTCISEVNLSILRSLQSVCALLWADLLLLHPEPVHHSIPLLDCLFTLLSTLLCLRVPASLPASQRLQSCCRWPKTQDVSTTNRGVLFMRKLKTRHLFFLLSNPIGSAFRPRYEPWRGRVALPLWGGGA